MDAITPEEVNEIKAVLRNFYPDSVVSKWNINIEVLRVLEKLIRKSEKCSKAFDLVPRPWDLSNPINWAKKQVRGAIMRYLRSDEGKHYLTCMKAAGLGMRTEFEMASSGI